ncbi:methyl-accepting chemotaxis protein [Parasedimentitalea psychrophila]|uniref:Methyl-accepting chemotaxis protein n=1 Tax=Parasedimentitalea psychrophila TaxID=2997337 RepID=A0A9Y2L3F8_9RHOB|nr:methyl-accepting chemotaxis protein [Parasedimentitalea psychrophila]WIY27265.1 methyl-accepting chemotaxis protein [Parasedimentitalea psychrophila]
MTDKNNPALRRFSLSNLKTKSKVISVALFPLLLIVAVGGVTMFNLNRMEESAGWVDHTQNVLGEARSIVASAVDMETGLRGYLLAGKDAFLAPYEGGQAKAYQTLVDLRETVSDNPRQVARLQEAEQALRGWQTDVAEQAIALRREIGDALTMNDMAAEVRKAKGKVFFDQFRAEIADFVAAEQALLEIRKEKINSIIESPFVNPVAIADGMERVEHTYVVIDTAKDLLAAAVDMETGMRGFLLSGDVVFLKPYHEGFTMMQILVAELSETVSDNPEQVARVVSAGDIITEWRATIVEPTLDMRRQIGSAETMDDMADLVGQGRGKTYFDGFRAIMADFQAEEQALMDTRRASSEQVSAMTKTMIPSAIAVSIVIGAGLAWFIGSSIANAVRTITASMRGLADGNNAVDIKGQERGDEIGEMARALEVFRDALVDMQDQEKLKAEGRDAELSAMVKELSHRLALLSQGDLSVQIHENFPEGYEQLRQDFNATVSNLSGIVEQVVETSGSIRNGADEISQASEDLSNRTESQAATLEETAAALDELTASVKSAAEGARSVENTMGEAGDEAKRSGQVVQDAVAAMSEIEQSSRHISQIISVIDDISFQTNLLALNAGVEAARAGEAGRGFAVVASEVRALAQRSSDAAMEIKTLISDSSKQVSGGVKLVGNAGVALESIVGQVSHISILVSEIAEGAAEQSTGLFEINTGMTQLDQVTQQNAAMVEEASAASHLLKSDAAKLTELMSHFKIGQGRAAAPGFSAPAAPTAHGTDDWSLDAEAMTPVAATGTDGKALWQDF